MSQLIPGIRTADGQKVKKGDRCFDYYSVKWGIIASDPNSEGWFDFTHDDETRLLLNGDRISSYEPEWAKKVLCGKAVWEDDGDPENGPHVHELGPCILKKGHVGNCSDV